MNLQPNPKLPVDACLVNRGIEQDGRVVATLNERFNLTSNEPGASQRSPDGGDL